MDIQKIFILFMLPALAYGLGSIPWGLIVARRLASVDIRKTGSGNIGATNVRRAGGNIPGVLTLAGDMLKGMLPVCLAIRLSGGGNGWGDLYISAIILAAFTGHLYPVYLKFRDGGKGVATAAGCFLAISPLAVLITLSGFILLVRGTRRVSVGSVGAAAILPFAVRAAGGSGTITACAALIGLGIVIRHRDNIRRLMAGTEPKI
ncbi:acyl-phosphate glycerol 3-phosphate acyltransfer ase [Desulfonema ishimotonii]|uniref:Glycerol-3-phosphate acyltransferase n=1 Tax=Desulfonema ishimotonii TaxID=45657 RepID=A0A401G4J1_9BACT|nr:glycerol-3-phosphate 1-O-acyltransferase PlsY [Desulfonema ishimotonii]GBC64103.1 acyl-phosphate glycerol 3-phosphate acyltransfer ase [Desulfonema ishimotonii]